MKDKYSMEVEDNILLAKRNTVDSIYSESRLEGIAVTFPETQQIYDGRNIAGLSVEDIVKVNNLKHAWQFLLDTIEYPIDLKYIRQLNCEVGAGIVFDAGKIRTSSVRITGTTWMPEIPNYEAAENRIKEIMESGLSYTEKAVDVMLYIMRSQLFYDGNKRTAQLAANQILIQNGKGLIHIPVEQQIEFLNMLVDYYESNQSEEIKKFLFEFSIEGIEKNKVQQPSIRKKEFYK